MTLPDDQRHARAATAVVRDPPTVHCGPDAAAELAADVDADDDSIYVTGTVLHDGLNKNAWGLTKRGAERAADTLRDADMTASHPPLRDGRYDRSMHGGQGAPIGRVVDTRVTTADQAMLRDGGYTAEYTAEVLDPTAKAQFEAGLRTGDNYGVSIGIYGNPEDAVCSVCRDAMADCEHDRFEEVEVDGEASDGEPETEIAGPLYDDCVSDHLASVYLPAYDGASATVDANASAAQAEAAAAGLDGYGVPEAATTLASPFDGADSSEPAAAQARERTDRQAQPDRTDDYYVHF